MWVLCWNWEPLTDPASSSQLFDGEWKVSWGGLCQVYSSSKQRRGLSTTLPCILTLHPAGHSHPLMVTFHLFCLRAEDVATCKWACNHSIKCASNRELAFFRPQSIGRLATYVGWYSVQSYMHNDNLTEGDLLCSSRIVAYFSFLASQSLA